MLAKDFTSFDNQLVRKNGTLVYSSYRGINNGPGENKSKKPTKNTMLRLLRRAGITEILKSLSP